MVTEIKTEHPHIVRTEGICGGRPRIAGTRITVELVAVFVNEGETVDSLLDSYPHLTRAGVHDALSYYYDHKAELDHAIEENSIAKAIERGEISVDSQGIVTFLKPPGAA
jgi:uncharacterized protein (DUF433 family)